jgi:hypothetical protein
VPCALNYLWKFVPEGNLDGVERGPGEGNQAINQSTNHSKEFEACHNFLAESGLFTRPNPVRPIASLVYMAHADLCLAHGGDPPETHVSGLICNNVCRNTVERPVPERNVPEFRVWNLSGVARGTPFGSNTRGSCRQEQIQVVEGFWILPENHAGRIDVNLLVIGWVVLENLGRHVSSVGFRV